MLLAYYVSAVNIETTYNALREEAAQRDGELIPEYAPFSNIALADTFQIHEEGDILDLTVFKNNNERIVRQKEAPINVIVGNPPYSVGQTSANDNNANLKYPTLDARIAETYAAKSTAISQRILYDAYLRAFRWATDRIGEQGVVAFVSNGGWIDGNTGDGVRLSMAEDFTDLYVFNLRGNARTAGEERRKEGGNVFGAGSRTNVTVTIGIKDPTKSDFALHYRDIGNYLTAEEKLKIVDSSTVESADWETITPNSHGDWLNQRSDDFATWPVIGEKKTNDLKFFQVHSLGLGTNRDAWTYNYSQAELCKNMTWTIDHYNKALVEFEPFSGNAQQFLKETTEYSDGTKVKWSSSLVPKFQRGERAQFDEDALRASLYRPFSKQHAYFDSMWNHRQAQLPSMFPTSGHQNIGYGVCAASNRTPFSLLVSDLFPNLSLFMDPAQFFSRFTWAPAEASDGGLFGEGASISEGESSIYGQVGEVVAGYVRKDNITDEIKVLYRDALGADITGDDIFHFVYGKLHDPNYREAYAADLKKMLPHIETPGTRDEFDKFAAAGQELMALHVNYENVDPWPLDIQVKVDESDRETWRVTKMRWAKRKDPETGKNVDDVTKLIYNKQVTISGIPAEADEYMLGSRSAIAWLIDRYQVKKDKASGIVNDPNDWADEVGNPRYIVDLIGRVTRVAMETVRIVDSLNEK